MSDATMAPAQPVPEPTPDSRPHWEGLEKGKFLIQRCAECGRMRHYPRPMCDACHAFAHDWVEAKGDARVHSWTVAHHPFHASFRPDLPYVLVTADLPEGVRVLARLRDAGPEALRPGMPLRLSVEDRGDGLMLPVFRLATG
jgi:hypothetical protein